ncbi:MAG: hypothetical protein K1X74_09700 [Pirellulales bacterium]|nr:hypothetical protein [Pirellulales bacterium]
MTTATIESPALEVDVIEELRLRRWARENYVSDELRNREWHPIVLDEMQKRDRELNALSAATA